MVAAESVLLASEYRRGRGITATFTLGFVVVRCWSRTKTFARLLFQFVGEYLVEHCLKASHQDRMALTIVLWFMMGQNQIKIIGLVPIVSC